MCSSMKRTCCADSSATWTTDMTQTILSDLPTVLLRSFVMSTEIDLLRHAVATLAYRAGKALRSAPPEFGGFSGAGRTPVQILADGRHEWRNSTPLGWDEEVARFFAALTLFDQRLATGKELGNPAGRLFQGPVADALTDTGQIAMLRRLAGCAVKGENYF